MPRRARPMVRPASRGNLHRTSDDAGNQTPRRVPRPGLRWPRAQPLRLPPAHRGAGPPRAARPHVLRRRARPRLRRRDLRVGDHAPVPQPGGPHLPRPQAGRRWPRSGSTAGRSTSTCSSAGGSRSSSTEGEHELVVEATMPFRNDGEGLHRSVDPADGKQLRLRHVVHGRGADDLRLLRPARPQGAVHLPRPRPAATGWSSATRPASRWSRGSGSSSRASRCRPTSSRSSPAPTTWSATSTTASRSASAPGPASRPTSTRTPTSCSR